MEKSTGTDAKKVAKTMAGKIAKRQGLDKRARNAENASSKGTPGTNNKMTALKISFMADIQDW